ncbi:MAG: diguanylate cyclase [Lachnospiraceae bacterium]|nr:diguanylate cyclase [Lachnospiraceae bacterium]
MFDFIRAHQLNIMLALSAACVTFALLLFFTKFLNKKNRAILILMEFVATFLLYFDRMAYIYAGNITRKGYILVRLSNFMVFFLTAAIVLVFDQYIIDLILRVAKTTDKVPRRLKFVAIASVVEIVMVIISQFKGFYYYFDENNYYHRGPLFLGCYVIPVLCPLIQYTAIRKYLRNVGKYIYISLVLYIFVPIVMAIIQIFTYGLSIVNMAMVLVSISLYIFTYLDVNEAVMRAHKIEMGELQKENKNILRLFNQLSTAFMTAEEKKHRYGHGHSVRVAEIARRVARMGGKSDDECDRIYYAALLNNVGIIGIDDRIIEEEENNEDESGFNKLKLEAGSEILSNFSDFPYLRDAIYHSDEWYDGSGYPDGLKGEKIPEIARIIGVCEAYDSMMSKKAYRDALPYQTVREDFIKLSGTRFDPVYADLMVKVMDQLNEEVSPEIYEVEKELDCKAYREKISNGIEITSAYTRITFKCTPDKVKEEEFSAPSFILYDSYNRRVHGPVREIENYRYLEYGEVWFDGHFIDTAARDMEIEITPKEKSKKRKGLGEKADIYEITVAKYEDHVKIRMETEDSVSVLTVALPDSTKSVYIGLTGEHCRIRDIEVTKTGEVITASDVKRLVKEYNFIDKMESDLPNIQVDRYRSATTEPIKLTNEVKFVFHTESLPSANLIWHCPFVIVYYSDDKRPEGDSYKEYALVKLNGEGTGNESCAENYIHMKKNEDFKGWDAWKEKNKEGVECTVSVVRKGDTVTVTSSNFGVDVENVTKLLDNPKELYVALTGDEVALTDIRVR